MNDVKVLPPVMNVTPSLGVDGIQYCVVAFQGYPSIFTVKLENLPDFVNECYLNFPKFINEYVTKRN